MPSRRTVLAALAAPLVAGCADRSGDPTSAPSPDTDAGTQDPTDAGPTASDDTTAADRSLDLREASVTGVAVDPADGGYRFDVTLHHDDDGEAGYADWWQVERLDGTRLGRRDLAHPHGTRPFTRSATVAVPDDAGCVVVRGHDQTHGYGGRAALVAPDAGAVRFVDQGSEPRAFAAADCPRTDG